MHASDERPLLAAIQQFLEAFETVFDADWAYSRRQLGIPDPAESDQATRALLELFGEAPVPPTPPNATFLHPGASVDLGAQNWGNYEHLLECYALIRSLTPRVLSSSTTDVSS